MNKTKSDIDLVLLEKRQFVHKLVAKIEQIGLSDQQRGLLLLDLARCFENQELASAVFTSLQEHLDETVRIGQDCDD